MGTSDSAWLRPRWRGWDAGAERPFHTTQTCLGRRVKRAKKVEGVSEEKPGRDAGVGRGAGTSGGGTGKLAEGFVG